MGTLRQRNPHLLIVPMIVLLAFQPLPYLRAQQAASITGVTADIPVSTSAPPNQQEMAEILRVLGEMRQELKDSRQEVEDLKRK